MEFKKLNFKEVSEQKVVEFNFKIFTGVNMLGAKVNGQEIIDMATAYVNRLKTIKNIDLSLENVGLILDMRSLQQTTGMQINNQTFDDAICIYGLVESINKATIIMLPRSNGSFVTDPDDMTQYIAYETWDPYFLTANAATPAALAALFIKSAKKQ
ncbi:MAG: hypothetical protein JSS96_03450 [Bacteroidetes bacterium]|nr:hypothetical protein [Bacteroidota bacterium]